jgi:hypothetical protein
LQPEPNAVQPLPIHPSLRQCAVKEVELKESGLRFSPHALGLRKGQTLVVVNQDPLPHHCCVTTQHFGLLLPPKGGTWRFSELEARPFPHSIVCNIHPWMKAWVGVFDHPYFAVTDESGRFEIPLAPAGNRRLQIWHEQVGCRVNREGERILVEKDRITLLGVLPLKPPRP